MFLLHFINTEVEFSFHLSEQEIRALFERRYLEGQDAQRKSEQLIAARTGKPVHEIRDLMHTGDSLRVRLNAEEAASIGLIDEIIPDPKGLFKKQ
jgi:ATP-dependent protease ClpP protease subunit